MRPTPWLPTGMRLRRRYIQQMRFGRTALLIVVLVLGALALPAPVFAQSTSELVQETVRNFRGNDHLVTFWWLPAEFWVAAAREMRKTPGEIEAISDLFDNYTLLGVMDVQFTPDGKMDALSTVEIVRRLEVWIDDVPFDVLKQVDPKLQQMSPELSYAFRVSLAEFGRGLRLLPFANLDSQARPIVSGSKPGVVRVRYKGEAGAAPLEFWWHAPLTAVAGSKKCPGSGAPMEASWTHCPWNGKKPEPAK